MKIQKLLLKIWLILLLGLGGSFAQAADGLQQLIANWQPVSAGFKFKEIRYDSLLDLETDYLGEMVNFSRQNFEVNYMQPGLVKIKIDPTTDNLLVINQGGEKQIPLERAGRLLAFITTFDALLRGDFASLAADFQLDLQLEQPSWQLILQPDKAKKANKYQPSKLILQGEIRNQIYQMTELKVEFADDSWRKFKLLIE